jgi:hypothetical protein
MGIGLDLAFNGPETCNEEEIYKNTQMKSVKAS